MEYYEEITRLLLDFLALSGQRPDLFGLPVLTDALMCIHKEVC